MRRLTALVVGFLALAAPALAHVEVSPEEAARGSEATLTFSVPNEEDSAATVKVEIVIPPEVNMAGVTPGDAPEGWIPAVGTDRVAWSGGKLTGEQEENFAVHIDALPSGAPDRLVFKALQTYDNGEVVRWIDEAPPGGEEPPHPAPVLKLTGAVAATSSTIATDLPTATTVARPDKGSNKGGIAAVIAVAVLVVGGLVAFALRGRRRGA